jgi:hypothetical protein
MVRRLKAIYSGKALIPQEPCDLPEGAVVELIVEGSLSLPPPVTDPDERGRILSGLVERMRRNGLPAGAPRFTREQLHERD